MDCLRVLIAEDNLFVREGLCRLIERHAGAQVVAVCASLSELLEGVETSAPTIVLTDIRMPPTDRDEGIQAARALRVTHPELGVVVLSQYVDPAYALALLEEGAQRRGYLLKERVGRPDELMRAIRAVADGGSSVDPLVVDALLSNRRRRATPLDTLTARETDILSELAQGKSNTAISVALKITEGVVEKHINAVFTKLGLTEDKATHRRVQAVLLYLGRRSP